MGFVFYSRPRNRTATASSGLLPGTLPGFASRSSFSSGILWRTSFWRIFRCIWVEPGLNAHSSTGGDCPSGNLPGIFRETSGKSSGKSRYLLWCLFWPRFSSPYRASGKLPGYFRAVSFLSGFSSGICSSTPLRVPLSGHSLCRGFWPDPIYINIYLQLII